MFRLVIGGLLVAHGLVHAALWLPQALGAPLPEGAPFDAGSSWLVSRVSDDGARMVAGALAVTAALMLTGAGVAYVTQQDWWRWLAIGGGGISLVLIALYWNVWLSVGALLDAAVIAGAVAASQAAPEA